MRSPCFSVRRWRSSVVLPAPRKPVRMETGTDDDSLAIDSLAQPRRGVRFSSVVGFDFSSLLFLFPWFAPCARKGRTSRSHRKNQWISSIFQLPPSRRRAPRQAENQRHHVQQKHQQQLENASKFILFWSPGALPETKPQKCSPAGSPGGSGALLARLLEAEIDQLSAPRGPQEAPHEFVGPLGRPRAAAKSDLRRSRRPPWAHMAPRSSQDPSGPSFWTLRPPSLGAFSIHFLRLPASFFEALPLPWVVLFRVRVRLRSMFRGLRRFNFASLKPSMPESLGGRRGSRSDMNYCMTR